MFTAVPEKDENVWFFFDVKSVVTKSGIRAPSTQSATVHVFPLPDGYANAFQ